MHLLNAPSVPLFLCGALLVIMAADLGRDNARWPDSPAPLARARLAVVVVVSALAGALFAAGIAELR